jgi:hypothetical protein
MIERDRKNGIDIKKKFEEEARKSTRAPKLLFAPDCIFSKGRYYLYFCGADDSEGVAVSDDPQGPFTEPVQLPCGGIDPRCLLMMTDRHIITGANYSPMALSLILICVHLTGQKSEIISLRKRNTIFMKDRR